MESVLIWHKQTEPVPADVEVIIIYKNDDFFDIVNYTYKFDGVKSKFAGKPIVAWAVCDISLIAWKINENFNEEWIEFLHKNATK